MSRIALVADFSSPIQQVGRAAPAIVQAIGRLQQHGPNQHPAPARHATNAISDMARDRTNAIPDMLTGGTNAILDMPRADTNAISDMSTGATNAIPDMRHPLDARLSAPQAATPPNPLRPSATGMRHHAG